MVRFRSIRTPNFHTVVAVASCPLPREYFERGSVTREELWARSVSFQSCFILSIVAHALMSPHAFVNMSGLVYRGTA